MQKRKLDLEMKDDKCKNIKLSTISYTCYIDFQIGQPINLP